MPEESREAPTLSIRRMCLAHCRKDCSVLTMPLATGDSCQSFEEEEEDDPPEEDVSSCSWCLFYSLSPAPGASANIHSFVIRWNVLWNRGQANPRRQLHLVTHICCGMLHHLCSRCESHIVLSFNISCRSGLSIQVQCVGEGVFKLAAAVNNQLLWSLELWFIFDGLLVVVMQR